MSATLAPEPAGSVAADELLTLAAVKQRLGLGVHSLRAARKRGLKVRRIGTRSFVLGRDLLDFVAARGKVVR